MRIATAALLLAACGSGQADAEHAPRARPDGGLQADGVPDAGQGAEAVGPVCTAQAPGVRLEADFVEIDPPIRFTGRRLDAASETAIQGLGEVLGRCPSARIDVRVSSSRPAEARARAAVISQALTRAGVDGSRFRARPVDSAFREGAPGDDPSGQEVDVVRVDPVDCVE